VFDPHEFFPHCVREKESVVETTEANLEEMIEAKVMIEAEMEEVVSEAQMKEQRLRDEINGAMLQA